MNTVLATIANPLCSKCGQPGLFRGRRKMCQECERQAARLYAKEHATQRSEWVAQNRGKVSAASVRYTRRVRAAHQTRLDALKSKPCSDCGQVFPTYVMDFDHRDPTIKVAGINSLIAKAVPWERIQTEVAKCDLVCVCCHRLRTLLQTGVSKHSKRQLVARLKKNQPCSDCGCVLYPCQMDFDHTQETKSGCVSRLSSGAQIRAEVLKCQIVCANCHRKRTQSRGNFHSRLSRISTVLVGG